MPLVPLNQLAADNLLAAWFAPAPDATPRFIVVLDVGQGNCNVVFNDHGRPIIYFDMGGGMGGSQFTYPHPAPTFCIDINYTLFVLSHWDEDHYRSLLALSNAGSVNNAQMLAPAQIRVNTAWQIAIQKSPTADALEDQLSVTDNVTINQWPDEDWHFAPAMHVSTHSHFSVIKVSGSNTNNHALALRLENPAVANQYILLTGDATFEQQAYLGNTDVFRHGVDQQVVGLVAGHHGAPVGHAPYIPRPDNAAGYLIAYSFGWGNAYGHPNVADGVTAYEGRGWDDDHRMDTGGAESAAKYAGPRGNVGLLWPGAAPGPCFANGASTPAQINGAAVSLIATASAEIDVYQNLLATRGQVAVGAAYQGAIEGRIPLVAAAMLAPAVQIPARTLAQRMIDMAGAAGLAGTNNNLAAAVGVCVATAGAAQNANTQELAKSVVDCVMLAAAHCAKAVTEWVEGVIDELLNDPNGPPILPTQAKIAAAEAFGCAVCAETLVLVHAAIPDDFANRVSVAAAARSALNVPSMAAIKTAVTGAVTSAAQARIGQPGGNLSQGPAEAAATAVAAMAAIRVDVLVAIAAAAGLQPAIPINPRAFAPAAVANNENAKLLPRIAAVAAICGTPTAVPAHVARAAVAAARVTLAAACGAPQIGCHQHPRTCVNAACSLSIHSFYSMFPAKLSTFAGTGANGNAGDAGQAAAAQLGSPSHVVYDAEWNLYVTDRANHRVRAIDASGVIRPCIGDGNQGYAGDSNAQALNASLRTPAGLATDPVRNRLFISDSASHRIRLVDLSTGIIQTIAGTGAAGFSGDGGQATAAQLNSPTGLALNASENLLYIADTANQRIRCVNLRTGKIDTVAGTGMAGNAGDNGPAIAAALNAPTAVAVSTTGELYIADTGNHRVRFIEMALMRPFAGTGIPGFAGDTGNAVPAQLNSPCALAIDSHDNVYIADRGNRRIRRVAGGLIGTFAGTGANGDTGDNNPRAAATFNTVCGLAVDINDNVYIVDSGHHRIRKVDIGTGDIEACVGSGAQGLSPDDQDATAADLHTPLAVAVIREEIFVAEAGNHRVCRVDGAADLSAHTGDGNNAHAGDSHHPATAARLDAPGGLAYDRDNHFLYVADTGNHIVRRVDLRSGQIRLIAGDTNAGFGGDDGPALDAQLDTPTDVAYDFKKDMLLICDRNNHRIRSVSMATGEITTFAGDGNGAWAGDGLAPGHASFHTPVAIAVDASSNVYVATIGDHRVRMIEWDDAMGIYVVRPFAGTGVQGDTGDGGAATAAQLDAPMGLAVDDAGIVYISSAAQHRVRKVEGGNIKALAGTGAGGFAGDGGLPSAGQLNGVTGLAVDQAGRNLFVADTGNRRIRRAIL